ncbi:MAG: alpha/beta fold hydrolase [Candidatus Kryptoniota bacterium]
MRRVVEVIAILIILLICPFAEGQEQKSSGDVKNNSLSWNLPSGVKTLQVNGYPMAYMERGSGSTVVFVHGSLSDYRYWNPQVASLGPRFRVIAVSLRHYYPERWDGKGEDFSIKTHAEDVAAFIERLNCGPVYLVGHSRGGSVALGAAKIRPDLIKKLVLMEPAVTALLPKPEGPPKPDPRQARAKTTAAFFAKGDMEGGLEYFVNEVNGPGAWKRRSEEVRQMNRDNAWTAIPMANDSDIVACDDLRKMGMPVLLVESEKGPGWLKTILNEAAKCLPSASHVLIPKAAHQMNRDNHAEFDRALVDFLSK